MIKVKFANSPLTSMHAARGIGRYSQQLQQALKATGQIEVLSSSVKQSADITHHPYFDLYFPTLPIRPFGKTVVTIHDLIPLVFPEQYPVGKKGQWHFFKQKLSLGFVSAIITDSAHCKKDIEIYLGVAKDKIFVVPLAAPIELKKPDPKSLQTIRRKLGLPVQYCLYVGDINYNKNLPQLIKALKYLPWNVKLVCVGKNFLSQDIPEWHAIENQVALSDVAHRVQFLTNVHVDDFVSLSVIYAGALCYVQPSLYEGFGLPVLEAMVCQTPVVSTQISALKEVAGKYAVLAETTAESLARSIQQVLNLSQTARKTLTTQAYEWSQKFSWEKTAKKTLAVYKYTLEH